MVRTLLTILTIALMFSCSKEGEDENMVFAGDRVPMFEINDAINPDAEPFNSADIDRPTLIYLFWSECSECHEQTPYIINIANIYGDAIDVVCIARGGSNASYDIAKRYWDDLYQNMHPEKMPFMGYDANRSVYSKFANSGVPRIYLVGSNGIVDSAYEGVQGNNSPLKSRIDNLLGK